MRVLKEDSLSNAPTSSPPQCATYNESTASDVVQATVTVSPSVYLMERSVAELEGEVNSSARARGIKATIPSTKAKTQRASVSVNMVSATIEERGVLLENAASGPAEFIAWLAR